MTTVSTYDISPTPGVGPDQNGDVLGLQRKPGASLAASGYYTDPTLFYGSVFPAVVYVGSFLRFEVDIPAGADIIGVAIHQYSTGVAVGTMPVRAGFIKRDGNWDAAGGFYNYATDGDLPWAQWNLNSGSDVTVWWGNAPAFSGTSKAAVTTAGAAWHFQQNISPGTAVTGLREQLKSYLADAGNEATRGTGYIANSIPVCIQMFRPWNGTGLQYQQVHSSDSATPSLRPQLVVEWQMPTPVAGAAELSGSGAVDAVGTNKIQFAAELAATSALDAVAEVIIQGATELAGSSALDAEGTALIQFAAELAGSSALDAVAEVIIQLEAELVGSSVLDALGSTLISAASELAGSSALDAFGYIFIPASNPLDAVLGDSFADAAYKADSAIITLPLQSADVTLPFATVDVIKE